MIQAAEDFVKNIHDVQQKVRQKLQISNEKYKNTTYLHRRIKLYEEGDDIMIYLHMERFPIKTYHKLQPKKISPYKVLR